MGSLMKKQAERFLREKKRHRRWLAMFLCLALLVTSGTFAALTMNGHAMDHGSKILSCRVRVHAHTEECFDGEGELTCGQADYVVHTHDGRCYDEEGGLVCQLPEREAHVHDSDCYKEEEVLICQEEETAGHQHSQECYIEEKGELQCSLPEHEHSEGCYDEMGNLLCGQEAHYHDDSCYVVNEMLVCGQEEGQGGHTHTDNCYEKEKTLACTELELHTHDKEACYDENGNLTCDILALEEHEHGDGCFEDAKEDAEMDLENEENLAGGESDESVSENSVSKDALDEHVSENSVSGNSVSGDVLSENGVSENSVSENSITLETKVDGIAIALSGPESSFEKGKELSIQAEKVKDDEQIEAIEKAIDKMAEKKEKEVKDYQAFDIKLLADDKEVQPLGPVEVKFSGKKVEKAVENKKTDVEVLHVDDETGKSTDMEATATEEKEVVIETEHFSVYVYVNLTDITGTIEVTVQHWGENIETLDGTQVATEETDDILRKYTEGGIDKAKPKLKKQKKQLYTSDEITIPNEYYANIEELSKVCEADKNDAQKRYTLSKVWIGEGAESNSNKGESWTGKYQEYINQNGVWKLNGQEVKKITLKDPSIIRFWYTPAEEREKKYDVTFYDYDITAGKTAGSNNLKSSEKGVNSPDNYASTNKANRLGIGQFSSGNVSSWTETAKVGDKFLNKGNVPNQLVTGIVQNLLDGGAKGKLKYNVTAPKSLFGAASNSGTTVYPNYELGFTQKGDTYILDKVYNSAGQMVEEHLSEFWYMKYRWGTTIPIYSNNFWPMDKVKGTDPLMGKPGGTYKFADDNGTVKYGKDETNDDQAKYSGTEGAHNWHFGMRYSVDFKIGDYTGPMEYYFRGDDDFWLFVDGELAVDIGGIHRALGESLDLWTWMKEHKKITYDANGNLQNKNATHTLDIFFMERGGTGSCCYMQFTVPNTKTVEIPTMETTKYSVTKDWEDNNSPYRPDSIKVRLIQEYTDTEKSETISKPTEKYAVLNADNNWTYNWEGLPKINGSTEGKYDYSYKVEEVNLPPGYTPVLVNGKLTNQLKPVKVEVKKKWQNDEGLETYRPDTIKLRLYANGEVYKDTDGNMKEISLSADNGWKGEFEGLPEYCNYRLSENGNSYEADKVVYSVKEVGTDGNPIDSNGYLTAAKGVQYAVTYSPEVTETKTPPMASAPQKVPSFADESQETQGPLEGEDESVEEDAEEEGDMAGDEDMADSGNAEITEDAEEGVLEETVAEEVNAGTTSYAAYSMPNSASAAEPQAGDGEPETVATLTVTNTLVKNFKIVKKDSNTDKDIPLSGAEFRLTPCDASGNVQGGDPISAPISITSGKDGMLNLDLKGLETGYYLMEETKAPAGYMLSRMKWIIQVVENYGMKEFGEVKSFKDLSDVPGAKSSNPENENFASSASSPGGLTLTYTFYNDEIYQLPSTGGAGIYWYTISGMLLMLGASLILYKNRYKRAVRRC